MAIKTYTEQLEEVQIAITAIVSGAQSYQLNGRILTRASLSSLQKREEYLRKMVSLYESESLTTVSKSPFTISRISPKW
ncbi:MAG: hypothetical protein AAGI66_09040 [Cyanobacteria bacterium P01_H01_bin.74]